jgi:VTC domain
MEKYMERHQLDDERWELKYVIPENLVSYFISLIYSKGFYEIYEKRLVNSIYFDNNNNSSLFDSINGVSKRKKSRIRWYSNDSNIQIEEKVKLKDIGYKNVQKIPYVGDQLSEKSNLLYEVSSLYFNGLSPVSAVRYHRRYFYHQVFKIRLTIDFQIETLDFQTQEARILGSYVVLEMKYLPGQSIVFPFERFNQKFSKYQFSRIGLNDC